MAGTGLALRKDTQGWESDTKIQNKFDRSIPGSDAVALTITEAINRWLELIDRPVLGEAITLSPFDGVFKRSLTGSDPPHSTAKFRFQHCDVTVCYGRSDRGTMDRRR